jgi:hypothetical protein
MPSQVWDTIERLGGHKSMVGKYNCWAMFALMNMMHSDYGGVLVQVAQGDMYAKAAYMMAVAWVDDPDRRWTIREYFGLE